MHAPIAQAASLGAELVVLPQLAGDMLVGVQVPTEPLASRAELAARGGFSDWYACVRRTAETTAQFYVHAFETLARRYGLYLLPGTISLPGEGNGPLSDAAPPIFHAAFLFGPEGEVLGEQRQRLPSAGDDGATGFGTALTPMDTPLGRIGVVVGDDALHTEVIRSAVAEGCNLVLNPSARRDSSASDTAITRWEMLWSNGIYVVESALAGGGFAGRAAIYGPRDRTAGTGGLMAQTPNDQGADLVSLEIQLS